jgi:hypothetical protein
VTDGPASQAQAALLAFGRNGRLEERIYSASHWLGDSPHDAGYLVAVSLSVTYDSATKSYRVALGISEHRYERGQVSYRNEREMPQKQLADATATRFSAKRAETLYNEALQQLRSDPTPLVELLQREAERE